MLIRRRKEKQAKNLSVLIADMSVESHIAAAATFTDAMRNYRASGWVNGLAKLRGSFLHFDYWWDRLVGDRILARDAAHKEPPVPISSLQRLEVDAFIAYRQAAKAQGLDVSLSASKENAATKAFLFGQARANNAVYVDAHNRMYHHMWHMWVLPPGSALSVISKYIAIGIITGTAAAAVWRYGYHLPERRKIDAFYKTLYTEHPEFWPALAMQKRNVRKTSYIH